MIIKGYLFWYSHHVDMITKMDVIIINLILPIKVRSSPTPITSFALFSVFGTTIASLIFHYSLIFYFVSMTMERLMILMISIAITIFLSSLSQSSTFIRFGSILLITYTYLFKYNTLSYGCNIYVTSKLLRKNIF